jgi:NAD(P)-dependent dehydrogenase (short-subunit alcohol dehydrogenase family)
MIASRLADKTAIVTGAGRGIGRAIAYRLASEGAWVAVVDKDLALAQRTAADAPGPALALGADVGDEESVVAAVSSVIEARGGVDIVVNNAGIAGPQVPAGNTELAGWDDTLRTNLTGTFLVSKHAIEHLRASRGCIVNIASALAFIGLRHEAAYGPTKAGVVQLTKGMALDYAPDVRVNAVCPGAVRTDMIVSVLAEGDREELLAEYGQIHPLYRRLAEPDEIADAVLFLASPDASFITGAALCVDGGLVAS